MEELRRRQEAEAARARRDRPPGSSPDEAKPGPESPAKDDEGNPGEAETEGQERPRRWDDTADEPGAPRSTADDADTPRPDETPAEPIRIRRSRGGGGRGGRRPPPRSRVPGGPNDGAPGPMRAVRRATLAVVALVI